MAKIAISNFCLSAQLIAQISLTSHEHLNHYQQMCYQVVLVPETLKEQILHSSIRKLYNTQLIPNSSPGSS
jgi:hypothetical protein